MRNAYTLPAMLLAGSLLGCKKTDTSPPRTDLLTNQNWVVTAAVVSPGLPVAGSTTLITDLYGQESACQKDNITVFQTPDVLEEDEGATKCSASDPQTLTGTWSLSADQTVITTTDASGTTSATIQALDATTLVVATSLSSGYTVTITYHHN